MRTVLLALTQLPQDPASGAARLMRAVCEMLAEPPRDDAGAPLHDPFRVVSVAVTASESSVPLDACAFLRRAGLDIAHDPALTSVAQPPEGAGVLRVHSRGVSHILLDTPGVTNWTWEDRFGQAFDRLFDAVLPDIRPDILFTFGERPSDERRMRAARALPGGHAAAVVFALQNACYFNARSFDLVDEIIVPSSYLAGLYRDRLGLRCTPIRPPVVPEDTIVPPGSHHPTHLVYVNPSREKGSMFFLRLADELARRRPDIPVLIVESRGKVRSLLDEGLRNGVDLTRHQSLVFSAGVAHPRDFLAVARALLVPAIWEEASALVSGEAQVNGVPVLASPRGGLPETTARGGFILPIPDDLTVDTAAPVPAAAVAPWIAIIERLWDDPRFYDASSTRAREAGRDWLPAAVSVRYADAFTRALRRGASGSAGAFAGPPSAT